MGGKIKMNKNSIFLILGITFLAFLNSLFNGFVIDDLPNIVYNEFYKLWDNWPRLFLPNSLLGQDNLYLHTQTINSSGSVSYRPIAASPILLTTILASLILLGIIFII